jgi:dienelactone hydrolase
MAWTNLLRRLRTLCFQRLRGLPAPVFLVSAIVLGARCAAAETISIKATRSFGSHATYLEAELFKPQGKGPFPAVVLMHGCGGWQPAALGALHDHAWYFLDRGYVVLNLDSFGPRGNSGGTVCESNAQLVNALDYRTNDAFDALHYLQTLQFVDPKSTFLMGQSNGGSVAINAAKMAGPHGFRAVAAYYPWCGSLGASNVKLTSPLIIFSGSRDDWVPARECRNRMSTGERLKVVEYPNAPHSFDLQIKLQRYLGKLVGFDKSATEDSRAQMLAFFNGHLEKNMQQLSKLDAAEKMSP